MNANSSKKYLQNASNIAQHLRRTAIAVLIASSLSSTLSMAPGHAAPELTVPDVTSKVVKKAASEFKPNELLVMASQGTDADDIKQSMEACHGTIVRTIGQGALTTYVVQTEKGQMEATEKTLSKDSNFSLVQRNYVANTDAATSVVPNDPYFSAQWHLAALNAPKTWSRATGSGQLIGVIDTGCNPSLNDLSGKTYAGYDAVARKAGQGPVYSANSIANNHGSEVATTAAAVTNNRTNGAGVATNAYVYPIKVANTQGAIYTDAILEAIYHAGSKGIKILNLSIGDPSDSFANSKKHASLHAYANWYHNQIGGLLFIALGNEAKSVSYPLSPNMIFVTAMNSKYGLASFSNYGTPAWFTAPGDGIVCTDRDGKVVSVPGTSFASPCAAGVAALVWSCNPRFRNTDVERIMINSCVRAGGKTWTPYYGYGLLDASAAVAAAGR